ncbi:sodium ion-translocating decarboxylase subunit beta [Fusibacter bizertensis]
MKKKHKTGVIALIGVVILLIATLFFNSDYMKSKETSSIGIIGGADGPTVIFLAGKNPFLSIVKCLGFIAVVVVGIVSLVKFGKKRKGL